MKINKKLLIFFTAFFSLFVSLSASADYGCDACTAYYDSSIYWWGDTCAPYPCPTCGTGYERCRCCCPSVETYCPGYCVTCAVTGQNSFSYYGYHYGNFVY